MASLVFKQASVDCSPQARMAKNEASNSKIARQLNLAFLNVSPAAVAFSSRFLPTAAD